jgi:hypothetical protein
MSETDLRGGDRDDEQVRTWPLKARQVGVDEVEVDR